MRDTPVALGPSDFSLYSGLDTLQLNRCKRAVGRPARTSPSRLVRARVKVTFLGTSKRLIARADAWPLLAKVSGNAPRARPGMARPTMQSQGSPFPVTLSDAEWQEKLNTLEYNCLRRGGTEPYRAGAFCKFFPSSGYFACRACDFPLYSASSKFQDPDWDAYASCFYTDARCHVGVRPDGAALENFCNNCGSHLGHVFYRDPHSPAPTKERH